MVSKWFKQRAAKTDAPDMVNVRWKKAPIYAYVSRVGQDPIAAFRWKWLVMMMWITITVNEHNIKIYYATACFYNLASFVLQLQRWLDISRRSLKLWPFEFPRALKPNKTVLDGMTDCSDSECCSHASCTDHIMCLSSNDPVEVLLRKQPPSVTASFYQRVKFLIEENSVQSYAHMDEYTER